MHQLNKETKILRLVDSCSKKNSMIQPLLSNYFLVNRGLPLVTMTLVVKHKIAFLAFVDFSRVNKVKLQTVDATPYIVLIQNTN